MDRFLARLRYPKRRRVDATLFAALAEAVGDTAPKDSSIFLSTAPSLFGPTIEGLAKAGLAGDRARLALEKPLGQDLASSRMINDAVAVHFPENRTFQ